MAKDMPATPVQKKVAEPFIRDIFSPSPREVKSTHTAELVIGLCGPIGSPLHNVADELKRILEESFAYECSIIRLSQIIEEQNGKQNTSSYYERAEMLIGGGNKLREKYGYSVLADLAIGKIAYERESFKQQEDKKRHESRRICHIIDSIKNQEELNAFRLVYRDMFYFIGVFSPLHIRERNLTNKGMSGEHIHKLVDRDSGEELKSGQTVRDTFPHADFFLRVGSESDKSIKTKLARFLDLVFQAEIVTPSAGETAMYQAASAAGNSACMSRQVGAAITDNSGELLSVGWNDVPKFSGDLYRFDPVADPLGERDRRCVNFGGKCYNDDEKDQITKQIASSLKDLIDEIFEKKLVVEKKPEIEPNELIQIESLLKKSKIGALLEFSRSIHAEMHAIILAGQKAGERVRGAKLYCTTYPCHSCARHLVAAGISEVYYIEPYRKSLAVKLHHDSITEVEEDGSKLRILPFDGVAPTKYLELFRAKGDERKSGDGKAVKRNRKEAIPKYEVSLESIPALEGLILSSLKDRKLIPDGGSSDAKKE